MRDVGCSGRDHVSLLVQIVAALHQCLIMKGAAIRIMKLAVSFLINLK